MGTYNASTPWGINEEYPTKCELLFLDLEKRLFLMVYSLEKENWEMPNVRFERGTILYPYQEILTVVRRNFVGGEEPLTVYCVHQSANYNSETKESWFHISFVIDVTHFSLKRQETTLVQWFDEKDEKQFFMDYGILIWRGFQAFQEDTETHPTLLQV